MVDSRAICYQCGRTYYKTYTNRVQYFCSKKCRQKHFNEQAKAQRAEKKNFSQD